MGSVEECCAVCADPLQWTAYGPCGHHEVCSRCVSRLRIVAKDKRCALCQQDTPALFFTRHMGDYTTKLTPEQFETLQERAQRGDLLHLKDVEGFFDDKEHFEMIRQLCSFTHQIFEKDGAPAQVFRTLESLKAAVNKQFKLQFCELCLTGRQAFVCEQILYSKAQLDQHCKHGDASGPLAENGFKGHPICQFCRERFYDRNELYRHMESRHEHCFICRRSNPDKYVYYRHYEELQDHFGKDHHLCPHPECLERKFVVFATDPEFKRHFAAEHGDEQKMSAAQRRAAMAISLPLEYRRGGDHTRPQEAVAPERPAIVIGGGGNVTGRLSRRGRGGHAGPMRHIRSDPAMSSALQASMESAQMEASVRDVAGGADSDNEGQVSEVTFSAEDFPAVSRQGLSNVAVGRWAAGSGGAGTGSLNPHDFPALPTQTKSAKRRAKEKEKTGKSLVQQLAAAGRPIRVVNRGAADGAGPSGFGGGLPPPAPPPAAGRAARVEEVDDDDDGDSDDASDAGPAQQPSAAGPGPSSSARLAAGLSGRPQPPPAAPSSEAFPALGGGSLALRPRDALSSIAQDYSLLARKKGQPAFRQSAPDLQAAAGSSDPLRQEDFPALPGGPAPSSSRAPPPRAMPPPFPSPPRQAAASPAPAAAAVAPAPPALQPEDFPSLAALAISTRAPPRPAAPSPQQPAAPPPPPLVQGGISESLKAANRALIDRIRRQLDDEDLFSEFRQQSGAFVRGELDASQYHASVVDLGLLPLAADLAALCPDSDKRAALMEAHKQFLTSPAAQDPRAMGRSWIPPEAALAAAQRAEQEASWPCPLCTLINGPSAARCEMCATPRPKQAATPAAAPAAPAPAAPALAPAASPVRIAIRVAAPSAPAPAPAPPAAALPNTADFPSLSAPSTSGGSALGDGPEDGPGGSKQKKNKKQTMQSFLEAQRVHPQNVWTQNRAPIVEPVVAPAAAAPKGQWSRGGGEKLARSVGATNDAWAKK